MTESANATHSLIRRYRAFPFRLRFVLAFAVGVGFVVVTSPKDVGYYPEGNWLPGPLWLLRVQSVTDQVIGVLITAGLLPMVVAYVVRPSGVLTAVTSVIGLMAWIGFGAWLAMMSVI